MELREYQQSAVETIKANLHNRPILVSPTGSGKTIMATTLVKQLNTRTLWLAHRKELIDQAAAELRKYATVGIIKSGYSSTAANIQVASVQTLVRRKKPPAELIVIDECHHAAARTYQKILDEYPDVPIIGLTATPFRLDGCGLGDLFGEIIIAAWTDELCNAGYLHRPKVWASKSPDLRGLRIIAGDYSIGALADRVNTDELNADIVQTWQKHAENKRTVVFAVDIKHSQAIIEAFRTANIKAEHIDAKSTDRDVVLSRLRAGKTQVVSNCMILTEGWDLPALECAIIARPTASLNLHLQMIGRIMRSCPGKNGAIVLDHAGNHHVHGLVTRRLDYTLDGKKVGYSEPLGLRRCRKCGLFFELTIYACPECGWTPSAAEVPRTRPEIHGHGKLTEFADNYEYQQQVWNLIEAERQAMGYKPGWSFYRFKERFGKSPLVSGHDLVNPDKATIKQKREVFEQFIRMARERGYKSGWAAHRYRSVFGVWPRGFVNEVRSIGRLREKLHAG